MHAAFRVRAYSVDKGANLLHVRVGVCGHAAAGFDLGFQAGGVFHRPGDLLAQPVEHLPQGDFLSFRVPVHLQHAVDVFLYPCFPRLHLGHIDAVRALPHEGAHPLELLRGEPAQQRGVADLQILARCGRFLYGYFTHPKGGVEGFVALGQVQGFDRREEHLVGDPVVFQNFLGDLGGERFDFQGIDLAEEFPLALGEVHGRRFVGRAESVRDTRRGAAQPDPGLESFGGGVCDAFKVLGRETFVREILFAVRFFRA